MDRPIQKLRSRHRSRKQFICAGDDQVQYGCSDQTARAGGEGWLSCLCRRSEQRVSLPSASHGSDKSRASLMRIAVTTAGGDCHRTATTPRCDTEIVGSRDDGVTIDGVGAGKRRREAVASGRTHSFVRAGTRALVRIGDEPERHLRLTAFSQRETLWSDELSCSRGISRTCR